MTMASMHSETSTLDPVLAAKLVETVVGAAWATDPVGRFLYVTSTAPAFGGLTPDDLNAPSEDGLGWRRVIHPDDYNAAAIAWRQALQSGAPYRMEHRVLGATGSFGWTRAAGQPMRGPDGLIVGWYGSLVDCLAPTPIAGPSDGRPLDMSTVHPHDRPAVAQASARAFFHGVPQVSSYRQLQADGSYRWTELRVESEHGAVVDPGIAIARQDEAWTIAESFGETLEAVQTARRLENLYGGAWALDARGRFTYATPTSQTSIGLTLDDLNESLDGREFIDGGEHGWKRTVHPEDYPQMADSFRTGLQRGEAWNVEYRVLRANGDYVWHRVGARPTHDSHGRVTGWYGISLDIDVYKKTEAALRESEHRLQQLIDAVPAQIWCLTAEGRPYYVNERMTEVVGIRVEDLIDANGSRSLTDIHPEQRAAVESALQRSLTTGEPFMMRCRQRRRDGAYRWTDIRGEPFRNALGETVQWYGVCIDVDSEVRAQEELRLAQQRLAHASQAASLAELSASIAHEVNQPLAAVVANSHACQRWLNAEPANLDRAQLTLERIIRDANAAADVVSRVRGLFKQAIPTQTSVPLASVIGEAEQLLLDVARIHGVRIETAADGNIPPVAVDPLQIQQVLVNLMRNGIEAMHDRGDQALQVRARRDGDFARIEVADEGIGVADPDRVFDPFFTTKKAGMGMGLAISRSIVESHGGRLWIERHCGNGTSFVFTLPLAAQASP